MIARWTGVKFIAFILVCLFFTIYLAFTIGNIRPSHLWFLHRDYTLQAYFDDVSGLNKDDNVKVAGVVVGKVTGIKIVDHQPGRSSDGTGRARVSLSIHKSVRLPANTTALIRWRNLLGQRYVYLNPPSTTDADPVVLRSGETIAKTTSVVDIGELFNRLGPIVTAIQPDKVNEFLQAFTQALSGNEESLRSSLDNLAQITASIAAHDDAIGRLVGNVNTVAATLSARDQEIRTVIDNLVAISGTFSQNTQIVDEAITNLNQVSTNVDRLLSANRNQVDRILVNVNTLLQEVVTKLPEVSTLLGSLPLVSNKLFSVGALGQWLNQDIQCGAVDVAPKQGLDVTVGCNLPINSGGSSTGAATPASGQAPATGGATGAAGAAAVANTPAAGTTSHLHGLDAVLHGLGAG
jgi:phospholipid/cholesterol/gamma-HCH transport system substrate-binding protein